MSFFCWSIRVEVVVLYVCAAMHRGGSFVVVMGLDLLIPYAAKKEVRMSHEGKEISGVCIQL